MQIELPYQNYKQLWVYFISHTCIPVMIETIRVTPNRVRNSAMDIKCTNSERVMSKFDAIYRSILLSKFFVKGWGKPDNLKKILEFRKIISDRSRCQNLVSSDYPVVIDQEYNKNDYKVLEGHFVTPLCHYLPEVVPQESVIARFQVITPKTWKSSHKPICLHLAGTGDHNLTLTLILAHGVRKPKAQSRSSLHNVSDLFVMGSCLILESLALFHWCERQGYGPLGITGISMGGHMASIAGCNWHKPIALTPCLSWTTASCAFTKGVLSGAIPWQLLESQYFSDNIYQNEIWKMIKSPEEGDAFLAGKRFAKGCENLDNSSQHSQFQAKLLSSNDPSQVSERMMNTSSQNNNSESASKAMDVINNSKKLFNLVPHEVKNLSNRSRWQQKHNIRAEARNFMRGIMDECTHIGNFSVPVDPSLCTVVAAKSDQYIPRDGLKQITEYWPGAKVKYINCGHIAAFLFNQHAFREAIIGDFKLLTEKYYGSRML
ncbi:Protein ABHD18 [Nymphon striatum]|nr:Protein ABHD18 [Nymphon striatum]